MRFLSEFLLLLQTIDWYEYQGLIQLSLYYIGLNHRKCDLRINDYSI